jgi:phosphate transport system protein
MDPLHTKQPKYAMNTQSEKHTLHRYDDELKIVHHLVQVMGTQVINQLKNALQALKTGDSAVAQHVIDEEAQINTLEVRVDRAIFQLIARHSPLAGDLRAVMTASKVVHNLERTGDEAAKLANLVILLHTQESHDPPSFPVDDIDRIGLLAVDVLEQAMEAYENQGELQAKSVTRVRSALNREFDFSLHQWLRNHDAVNHNLGNAVSTILMGKALERIGDHAQNIADYVLFQIQGTTMPHEKKPSDA